MGTRVSDAEPSAGPSTTAKKGDVNGARSTTDPLGEGAAASLPGGRAATRSAPSPRKSESVFLSDEERRLAGVWPLDLFENNRPRYFDDPVNFIEELLTGDFIHGVYVLRDGCRKLGLELQSCFEPELADCLSNAKDVREFLLELQRKGLADTYKARVQYLVTKELGQDAAEIGAENKDANNKYLLHYQKEISREKDLPAQIDRVEELLSSKTVRAGDLYLTELRQRDERRHPLQPKERVKTALQRDMRDVCAEYGEYSLYWDRYDEGVFLGGHLSGKALHIDQILWQNVGKNWTGHKLLAAWPVWETSELLSQVSDCLFLPGNRGSGTTSAPSSTPTSLELPPLELSLLNRAAAVCLIRPGDVFYFTGGVPHVTLSVGTEQMNVCAYESIVTLNRSHVAHFLSQSTKWRGFETTGLMERYHEMGMPEKELEEVKQDMVDRLTAVADRWLDALDYAEEAVEPRPENRDSQGQMMRSTRSGSSKPPPTETGPVEVRDWLQEALDCWKTEYPGYLNVVAEALLPCRNDREGARAGLEATVTAALRDHISDSTLLYPSLGPNVDEIWRAMKNSDLLSRLQRHFIECVNLCLRDDVLGVPGACLIVIIYVFQMPQQLQAAGTVYQQSGYVETAEDFFRKLSSSFHGSPLLDLAFEVDPCTLEMVPKLGRDTDNDAAGFVDANAHMRLPGFPEKPLLPVVAVTPQTTTPSSTRDPSPSTNMHWGAINDGTHRTNCQQFVYDQQPQAVNCQQFVYDQQAQVGHQQHRGHFLNDAHPSTLMSHGPATSQNRGCDTTGSGQQEMELRNRKQPCCAVPPPPFLGKHVCRQPGDAKATTAESVQSAAGEILAQRTQVTLAQGFMNQSAMVRGALLQGDAGHPDEMTIIRQQVDVGSTAKPSKITQMKNRLWSLIWWVLALIAVAQFFMLATGLRPWRV
eukprot:g12745.t1